MPFDIAWVRSRLPERRVEWHPSLPTTMAAASRLAEAGCDSGTVVGADEQTAGKGRYGRMWHSEPDAGLYVSIVIRRRFPSHSVPLVTLALGLAVTEAILKTTGLVCDLRWPNDVMIQGKKCAGILTQLEASVIIAGIGINVNQTSFQKDLRTIATSLAIAGDRQHSRERLLVELLPRVDDLCDLLEKEGREPILKMFSLASSFVSGRRVEVDLTGSVLRGTTAGLNESGFLILRGDDGIENVIVAGGVRPCS